jgi:hypothetical protein
MPVDAGSSVDVFSTARAHRRQRSTSTAATTGRCGITPPAPALCRTAEETEDMVKTEPEDEWEDGDDTEEDLLDDDKAECCFFMGREAMAMADRRAKTG